jgi:hypothetical protein
MYFIVYMRPECIFIDAMYREENLNRTMLKMCKFNIREQLVNSIKNSPASMVASKGEVE